MKDQITKQDVANALHLDAKYVACFRNGDTLRVDENSVIVENSGIEVDRLYLDDKSTCDCVAEYATQRQINREFLVYMGVDKREKHRIGIGNPLTKFEVGDRVITDGRHGVITDVKSFGTETLSIYGNEPVLVTWTHWCVVKTDAGKEFRPSFSSLILETGTPPEVVEDPVVGGKHVTPDELRNTIDDYKRRISLALSSAKRRRIQERKQSDLRHVENLSVQLKELEDIEREYNLRAGIDPSPSPSPSPTPETESTPEPELRMWETIHPKNGEKLFYCAPKSRVDKDIFEKLRISATKSGGFWCKYGKGFRFSNPDDRSKFVAEYES
jgi:hypothetical protein